MDDDFEEKALLLMQAILSNSQVDPLNPNVAIVAVSHLKALEGAMAAADYINSVQNNQNAPTSPSEQ